MQQKRDGNPYHAGKEEAALADDIAWSATHIVESERKGMDERFAPPRSMATEVTDLILIVL